MSLLAWLLLVAAAAGNSSAVTRDPIPEMTFQSNDYCLPLAYGLRFELPKADARLGGAAVANATATGWEVYFDRAFAKRPSGPAYYVFASKKYVHIYLVFETNAKRKSFVRKFRYFSRSDRCTLPWPPEA